MEACLENKPANILDLCCGTGDLAISTSQAAKHSVQITGYDLNPEMLEVARQKATRFHATSIEFVRGDAGSMPFMDGTFDCITIGFGFRNLTFQNPNRDQHIREMHRVLKPGARLYILESARPQNRFIDFFYSLYLRLFLVPLGGMLSGDWNAYRYLAGSSADFYSFPDLRNMLEHYHLDLQLAKKYLFGSVNLLVATKID